MKGCGGYCHQGRYECDSPEECGLDEPPAIDRASFLILVGCIAAAVALALALAGLFVVWGSP